MMMMMLLLSMARLVTAFGYSTTVEETRVYELAIPSFSCPNATLGFRYTMTGNFPGLLRVTFTARDCQVVDDPCEDDVDYNFVDAEFAMSSTQNFIASAGVVTLDPRRGAPLQNFTQVIYPSFIYDSMTDTVALDIGPYFLNPQDPFGDPIVDETAQALKALGPLVRVPLADCGL